MSGKEAQDQNADAPRVDNASTDNLIGFFALLLEIDIRNNPDLYRAKQENEHD